MLDLSASSINKPSPSENQGFLRVSLQSKKGNGVGENRI
jgi:hypothetical protein